MRLGDAVEQLGHLGVEHAGLHERVVPRAEQRIDGVGLWPVLVVLPVLGLGWMAGPWRSAADAVEDHQAVERVEGLERGLLVGDRPHGLGSLTPSFPRAKRGARGLVVGLAAAG